MPLDIDKYLSYLDDYEISSAEKVEFIEARHFLVQMLMDIDDLERAA